MKSITTLLIIAGFAFSSVSAQESCLTSENLIHLDASWEKAQLELDLEFIDLLLADEFIWVHNHANTIDNKTAVLDRVKRYIKENVNNTKSRNSKDVKVIISGATGIVSGFTIVDRGPSPTTYHFMRTYVESDGKCHLIASQTMAVPKGG